ncbi:MAG: hypothetical protein QOH58_234 [Thermoleophilaceae bacterium]|jgi:signal transduction histidine kinase|nr:hypothetical protein [Thermoleophilaceae bacterium]
MPRPQVNRAEVLLAVACGAWAAVFFAPEGAAALAVAPVLGLAVLPLRRRPELSGLAVAAAIGLAAAAGVPEENAGTLAGGLTAVYGLGRYAGRRGLGVVAAMAVALVVPEGFALPDVLFVAVVLAATWACGRLVRRRTGSARRAAARAAELAAQDPEDLAAGVVAEERARLAGAALAVVRGAVETMRRDALAAEQALDPRALAAVQEGGRAAVADLRRLLGLLRAEEQPDVGAPAAPVPSRRLPPRADVATAAGLAAVAVAETMAWGPSTPAASLALTLLLVGCVALRRWDAPLACALAMAPSALAAALDEPLVYGFGIAATLALLAWSAGTDGRPRALAAVAVLAGVTVAVARADDPGNEGILLVTFALPAVAGHLWAVRGREVDASEATAAGLRAAQEEAAERAVRGERLRLARELHDVASHAVGVMVLQAGAALALRGRDDAAARAALGAVQRAGSEAVAELDVLFGVLDAGAVGPPGLATPAADLDLGPALRALVDRIRGAGLDVTLAMPEGLTVEPETAATALRVVQEALTNAVRHAPGSRVAVGLELAPGQLAVAVQDDGPGAGTHEPGFGLAGLAERVRAAGGELSAGPRAGGGFAVTARLPAPVRTEAPA